MRTRRITVLLAGALAVAGCAATERASTQTTGTSSTGTRAAGTPAAGTLPAGTLLAVPTRSRDDVVAQRFQVRIVNGTAERLHVTGLQFVWDGFSTEEVPRDDTVVAGQRVDFPLPFAAAVCDGREPGEPPSLAAAVVRLRVDGKVREVPVVDLDGVAKAIWREDCERQFVLAQVELAWSDARTLTVDGRPVTGATLRVERRAATGEVTVFSVGDTIPFRVAPVSTTSGAGEPWIVLPAGSARVLLPVQFVEARCDAHAVAEAKQPFRFVVRLDLGDGVERTLAVEPPEEAKQAMLDVAVEACEILQETGALG